eukprot:COSAG01_NODE_3427_length_6093_cov_9.704943_7_plen_46_part_00
MMIGYGLLEPIGINRYVNSGSDTSRNQRIAYGFKRIFAPSWMTAC